MQIIQSDKAVGTSNEGCGLLEKRKREQVTVDDMQFGFTPGKGTTDAILVVKQMQERHQRKGKKLYYVFADMKKAFDRVPREVARWTL